MGFQPLPSIANGRRYLPLPRGQFVVGTSDLMTNSVFMRCFYPVSHKTESSYFDSFDRWPAWLPNLEYADGYMRFKFSSGNTFAARLFRWLVLDPKCPSLHNAPMMKVEKPLPVLIFSHGMGSMRTTHSMLLSELASRGYFVAAVEHRDGSAACAMNSDGSWMFERKLSPDEDEYSVRNGQVRQRVQECESAFELLANLTSGNATNEEWAQFKPTDEFLHSVKHSLDMNNGCYISGHSFGSATALRALYTSKLPSSNGSPMFKKAVLYDSWMFPLRKEAEELSQQEKIKPQAFFINCQKFQGLKNLETMHHFETDIGDGLSNVLTLRDAMHYAPTDIPTVFLGSRARLPFSWLFRMSAQDVIPPSEDGPAPLPASKSVEVCGELGIRFMTNNLKAYVEKIERYLIQGTDYVKE